MDAKPVLHFIRERERVRVAKEENSAPRPWTKDTILQRYRFCNVRREDDKVTRWIAKNWRDVKANRDDQDLWFAMLAARFFNEISTLEVMGYPGKSWDPLGVGAKLRIHRDSGRLFNPAYIVSTSGQSMDKLDYVIDQVLTPAWEVREQVRPTKQDSLASFAGRLMGLHGLKGFMTGQVVADMKYAPVLRKAHDWQTWAISGPGSRRGLNRLCGRPLDQSWKESEWLQTLGALQAEVNAQLKKEGHPVYPIHAQDLQNCLCETDKYLRAKLGEGKPKQNYPGY